MKQKCGAAKRIIAMLLAIVMLFSTSGEMLANQVYETSSVEEQEGDFNEHNTGLLPRQVIELSAEDMSDHMYNYEDILGVSTYSAIYNSEWDKYSTNYVYNQMTGEAKQVWDALDALCLQYLDSTVDATTTTILGETYNCTDMVSMGNYSYEETIYIAWYFIFSNPQYYFLNNYVFTTQDGYGNMYVGFGVYDAFKNGEDRLDATRAVKAQITEWENEVAKCNTDYEKVQRIHELVCQKVVYNDSFFDEGFSEETAFTQSAYSVLCMDTTVCAGYAEAVQMMCNSAGIDTLCVTSADHQWNKVRVNGAWYNVDATWADDTNVIYYEYFMRSDRYYDEDPNECNVASHTEEYYWEVIIPECILDTNPSYPYTSPGTLPTQHGKVSTPVIEVTSVSNGYLVEMSTDTEDALIYYTLDGVNPSEAFSKATFYDGPFVIQTPAEIKAIAVRNGYADSEIENYIFGYQIGYVLNGGKNHASNPTRYTYGEKVSLRYPTRTGFTFLGWYSDSAFKNRVKEISQDMSGDITLYAKWKANQYTIKFDGNGATSGSVKDMTSLKYATRYDLNANAYKRTGYTFTGWNTKADGTGTSYSDKENVKNLATKSGDTVTLYAQWEKVNYTITYQLNNGTNNKNNPTKYDVTTATITLKYPTKTGFTFLGWYSDSAFKNRVKEIPKGSTGNKTLYAKWKANQYTIKFDGNGATSGSVKDMTSLKYATRYDLNANAYKRTGYTFTGWNTKADGTGTAYTDKANVKNLTIKNGETVTLYAQWKKETYTISYELNRGTNNKNNPTKYDVTTKTITLKYPTRTGYNFLGWYSDANFKTRVKEITQGSTGDITLYAKWKANQYTIKFDGNGATSGKMSNLTGLKYATRYDLTANAYKRSGYTFAGWNTKADGSGTLYKDKEKIKNLTTKNGETIVLYAQWVKK